MNSELVQLRHPRAENPEGNEDSQVIQRRHRPRSASYVALRSAVYQLTSLADFTLEKIGFGFFADVYKVHHKTTGEVMVLKMNKSRKTSRAMLSEIQLMNRLSHPNILKFKGSCVHEGHLHALTEYINGGSLEELLMDDTIQLSWSVRLKIIRDIVNGMVYLHSKNVFHRDLNPKNCLIRKNSDGTLQTIVADFGLAAKIKQRRRRSHTEAVGSPYWMAPELLKGKNYCEQADVFSFGITLAEIVARISADPDFMPRTQKYGLDMDAMRPLCADCPEELLELLDRCCQIDPDDRPSFDEISNFLNAIHLQLPPEDQTLPPTPTIPSTLDSRRDLRGCISEPTIRLTDDDDSRSCGSEGESRVIVEEHSARHRHHLLGSLGSSTSSCGSVGEYSDTDGHYLETDDDALADSVATRPAGDADGDGTNTRDLPFTGKRSSSDIRNSSSDSRPGRSKCLFRRTSDLVIHQSAPLDVNQHRALHKSKSLNAEFEPLQPQPLLPPRGALNSSAQTLVPEDEVGRRECAGDSGIDPGDLEVFKFPLTSTSPRPPHIAAAAAAELLGNQGDNTPICTSPNLNQDTRSYCTSTSKATTINDSHASLVRDRYSFSGTSSDEMTDFDSTSFMSPNGQCTSPLGPWSTTSSELSYSLPTPSTPWAPPPSPFRSNTPHSLPTSPVHLYRHHAHMQTSIKQQYRKSAEVTSKNVVYPSSCLRKTSSNSCRTSALFSDVKDAGSFDSEEEFKRKLSIKSVHFVDDSDCGSIDSGTKLYSDEDLEFDHESSKFVLQQRHRHRSKSNPQNRISGGDITIAHFGEVLPGGEYGIRLKQDWIDADPHSCKCYKIGQHSNTRLSSSTPDLSKLLTPFLMAPTTSFSSN